MNLLFLTVGIGFVPVAVFGVLGLALKLPFPAAADHLLRLAGAIARPVGSRVVDHEGRSSLHMLPLLGALLAADFLARTLDPDQLLTSDTVTPSSPTPPQTLERGELGKLALAVLSVAHAFTIGWWLALFHLVVGLGLCLTIVGALFGVRHFALIPVALLPLMHRVERPGERPWVDPLPDR